MVVINYVYPCMPMLIGQSCKLLGSNLVISIKLTLAVKFGVKITRICANQIKSFIIEFNWDQSKGIVSKLDKTKRCCKTDT